jgi:hypothetical protein
MIPGGNDMFSLGCLLATDDDFETAVNFQIIVSITQKG